jgi:hypothetical protein
MGGGGAFIAGNVKNPDTHVFFLVYLIDDILEWSTGGRQTNSSELTDSYGLLEEKIFKPWMDFSLGTKERKHEENYERCQHNAYNEKR